MNPTTLSTNIHQALTKELLTRELNQYFHNKGITNPNKPIYPPTIQDLPNIPQLTGKIEIIPHIHELDPQTGITQLGWNLFILGNQRQYLGTTTHNNLNEIKTNIQTQQYTPNGPNYTTPQRIINFIIKILSKNKNHNPNTQQNTTTQPPLDIGSTIGQTNQFYKKHPVY
jgi:hypothetical protein